jgi:hypothetical protein
VRKADVNDPMLDPKYTVYPHQRRFAQGSPLDEDTYFVLRDTDVLATSLLWLYVHEIQTVLELDREREMLTESERAYLTTMEDRVTALAREWQMKGKGRLPD